MAADDLKIMGNWFLAFIGLITLTIVGCAGLGGSTDRIGTPGLAPETPAYRASTSKIQHVVILVQENRSFDNLFDCFPGSDCVKTAPGPDANPHPTADPSSSPCPNPAPTASPGPTPTPIQITFRANLVAYDIDHSYCPAFQTDKDNGKWNGFYWAVYGGPGQIAHAYPYRVVAESQIQPYWDMATQYVLADHMFSTQASSSFTAHQDLIRGSTKIDPYDSVVDLPYNSQGIDSWGCDDAPGSVTSLLSVKGDYKALKGPFPCFGPTRYGTLRDLLDAKKITWKYYVPIFGKNGGQLWNAFDAVHAVRYDVDEWKHGATNASGVSMPETNFFKDLSSGKFASVTWVIPAGPNSDHGYGSQLGADNGPDWVASVVNAVGQSKYWDSTAIFVLWDEWGGYYDSVPPPRLDYEGLGFRVPLIIVSAYAKKGYVSHTQYEYGSLLKFVEQTFNLGTLYTTDQRANDITDPFDFTRKPRDFVPIKLLNRKHDQSFFLHELPSNQPVDTQ
jgi:phospholipase C